MREPPTGIKLIRSENVLAVAWSESERARYAVRTIRCDCRCAECVDEVTGQRILDVAAVPQDIGITDMKLVGNYSVKFTFSDGHDFGLFTWDHLFALPEAT